MTNNTNEAAVDGYFGLCPHCHRHDGYTNVGKGLWFFCREHRVTWFAGANVFSSWRDETENEQRRAYDEIGLGEFEQVEPFYPEQPPVIAFIAPVSPVADSDIPF